MAGEREEEGGVDEALEPGTQDGDAVSQEESGLDGVSGGEDSNGEEEEERTKEEGRRVPEVKSERHSVELGHLSCNHRKPVKLDIGDSGD